MQQQRQPIQASEKQLRYWREANHRWNIKSGATRSGKTYMDYSLLPKRILAGRGKEGLNVLLGNTRETLRRNILIPMQERYGIGRVSSLRADNSCTMFGEQVFCLGADNAAHVDRIRGTSIKYCYGDEVATWSKDIFDMLKSRLDKPYSLFDGTCNPAAPTHWFKEFLDSDADIYHQRYTLDDNPFLDPAFVENLKKEYAGTVLYDRYILGEWAADEGMLFITHPSYTDDADLFRDGIAHVDCSYGGADYTAFTCANRIGDKLYLYGKLWDKHIDLVMDKIIYDMRRLRCEPIYLETNADKGFVGREFRNRGVEAIMYSEQENKYHKIATCLRKWWPNITFLSETDKSYIAQIMSYNEAAKHDDAPDSAAVICRLFDRRHIELFDLE